jgi:hypothetical protein
VEIKCLRRRGFLNQQAKIPSVDTVIYCNGRMRTARDGGGAHIGAARRSLPNLLPEFGPAWSRGISARHSKSGYRNRHPLAPDEQSVQLNSNVHVMHTPIS